MTPEVSATASDPDSFEMFYAFEVRDAAGQLVASSPADAKVANPSPGTQIPLTFPVPSGALAEGGSYTARVQVGDETAPITPNGSYD